jgi:hypothetical protein
MKSVVTAAALTLTALAASAGPTCTAPKESWKPEAQFQQELKDQGYSIRNFKVTKGHCYEMYGTDKTGKKVEIYFDPATGRAIESK